MAMQTVDNTKQYKRIGELSKPKPLPAGFIEDKRSVYSESKIVKENSSDPTKFLLTPRLDQLCQPKPYHNSFAQDRPTPIWAVSGGAKGATASSGLENLAKPKSIHREWVEGRPVQTVVQQSALQANASQRLEALATPKRTTSISQENHDWDYSEVSSKISPAAIKAIASSRVEALAQEKQTHPAYQPPCPVQSIVSANTMKAKASAHITTLARPKDRKELEENPNVWKVTSGAKAAQASQRVSDLAQPIPRKVRTKKSTGVAA